MNNLMEDTKPTLNKFSPETDTCYGKEIEGFTDGFLNQFHESFFYALVLQFLLVTLMYNSVGKGIYWKVLFYASVAGLLATICENATIAFVCRKGQEENNSSIHFILLIIDEIFWIISEYAIPYLNLIKMKAFARGKFAIIIRYAIYGLFIPFIAFRFLIGYNRVKRGYLQDTDIRRLHGYAFGVMAVADIICTFAILYFVRKNNSQVAASASLNHYVKHSSYTILLAVDVVSALLSVLNIITNVSLTDAIILKSVTVPLHCLKSSFVLILAIDALLFKYGAHVVSVNESSSGNSKNHNNSSGYPYKSVSFNTKPKPGYTIDMTANGGIKAVPSINSGSTNKKANVSNILPYNYVSDKDVYGGISGTSKINNKGNSPMFTPSKTIVKNYTNIQTNSMLFETPLDKKLEVNNMYSTKHFNYSKY